MAINFKILRGHNLRENSSKYVPEEGVLCWGMDTNQLFIGDGKTMIKDLKGISNICKAPNGKLYAVYVNDVGYATVKPLSTVVDYYNKKAIFDFYAE